MIKNEKIKSLIKEELIRANTRFDPDALKFLEKYEGPFAEFLKENAKTAGRNGLPLCQDTGMVEFFVFMGHKICLSDPIEKILEESVREVYTRQPYRYSTVEDPLFKRKNRRNNTPPICHIFQTEGTGLEVRFLTKGGGSENLSRLFMPNPSEGPDTVKKLIVDHIRENGARGCPPLNIGIGIGGSSDKAIVLSKLALTVPFGDRNPNPEYARLETELLEELNSLHIGYQGLGKGVTAYSVHAKEFPTHIATLPVAVSVDCYLSRKGRIVFEL